MSCSAPAGGSRRQPCRPCSGLASRRLRSGASAPTANLDFGNQQRVLAQIRALTARGYTVLLSTHNPEHALHYAHRVLALQGGHIAADGPTETALTPQLLQTLYGIQAILAEVPADHGTVRSLIVTEDME